MRGTYLLSLSLMGARVFVVKATVMIVGVVMRNRAVTQEGWQVM